MTISHAINSHEKDNQGILEVFWFEGTTALKRGEAVCYNLDFGTAGDADARRGHRVEVPSRTNNRAFAGVAVHDYAAEASGQRIECYVPGSKSVPVALGIDTVLGTGIVTFMASAQAVAAGTTPTGRFFAGKFKGRGSAIPRQTVTALLESSLTGVASLATDGVTLTVLDSADYTVGDTVLVLGGEDEDGTIYTKPGKYLVASITSGTEIVLATSVASATPGAALLITFVLYNGNPTAMCDLLDGEESGGVEFLTPPNAGAGAQTHMLGGVTYVCGGITLAADVDVDLAQGTYFGELKAFELLGTLTTSDFTVDLVTTGLKIARTTDLAEVNAIDAAGEGCILRYQGDLWAAEAILGSAVEA